MPLHAAGASHPVDLLEPRPSVRGKFLAVGGEKFYARGVTYGPFGPAGSPDEYHRPARVAVDFARMRECGITAVRTYTVPPRWLLDLAQENALRVMVGLAWEQHVAFLDSAERMRAIERRVREGVRACGGHPAVLCVALGNEIPAPLVRWYGRTRVERFLHRLYRAAKEEDPELLLTYVNYPTTEYLQLPFLDLVCFNVYLESQERLEAYLARLQNLAGDRPLLMAEVGLDSRRNGEAAQASALDWQLRTAFAGGCAGTFVFSWTDEWHRGGQPIDDWDFGVIRRDRSAKPALATLRRAYAEVPFAAGSAWPRVSVAICTCNGARTLHECLVGVFGLRYPDFEVIVVDDGSTDETALIAAEFDVRLIRHPSRRGLSCARNTALEAAEGDIVAYIDDDAYPDPDWLTYLAHAFVDGGYAGVGGPNLPPPGDGEVAECVANAPGGPIHVLLSDREAEHIPGCNMAFWKADLESVGGFDPQFTVAGDDVDICWRLQAVGWKLGFSPAAMVWHHRRGSIRTYWRQQKGYGKAEAMLERKWPEKYNSLGHVAWAGRLYGRGLTHLFGLSRGRIYQGSWGSAPFQSIYQPAPDLISSLCLMPEWYLAIALLGLLSLVGAIWPPLLVCTVLLVFAVAAPVTHAAVAGVRAFPTGVRSEPSRRVRLRVVTAFLHLLQPMARLVGRLRYGLTPWRRHGADPVDFPIPRVTTIWSEHWRAPDQWLGAVESSLRGRGFLVIRGGDFDAWDLEVRSGSLGAVRIRMAIEEHGSGRQLVRFRSQPRWSPWRVGLVGVFASLSVGAALNGVGLASGVLGAIALLLGGRKAYERAVATAAVSRTLHSLREQSESSDRTIHAADEPRPLLTLPIHPGAAAALRKAGAAPEPPAGVAPGSGSEVPVPWIFPRVRERVLDRRNR